MLAKIIGVRVSRGQPHQRLEFWPHGTLRSTREARDGGQQQTLAVLVIVTNSPRSGRAGGFFDVYPLDSTISRPHLVVVSCPNGLLMTRTSSTCAPVRGAEKGGLPSCRMLWCHRPGQR